MISTEPFECSRYLKLPMVRSSYTSPNVSTRSVCTEPSVAAALGPADVPDVYEATQHGIRMSLISGRGTCSSVLIRSWHVAAVVFLLHPPKGHCQVIDQVLFFVDLKFDHDAMMPSFSTPYTIICRLQRRWAWRGRGTDRRPRQMPRRWAIAQGRKDGRNRYHRKVRLRALVWKCASVSFLDRLIPIIVITCLVGHHSRAWPSKPQ